MLEQASEFIDQARINGLLIPGPIIPFERAIFSKNDIVFTQALLVI